jgi:hypothetical protein
MGWAISAIREKADNPATEPQRYRAIPCSQGKKRQSNSAEHRMKNIEHGCSAAVFDFVAPVWYNK